eukprot:scaffold7862_cov63-Phaeocystis_antarctica.AAC.1
MRLEGSTTPLQPSDDAHLHCGLVHEQDRVLEAVELALCQARLRLLRLGELLGRGGGRRAGLRHGGERERVRTALVRHAAEEVGDAEEHAALERAVGCVEVDVPQVGGRARVVVDRARQLLQQHVVALQQLHQQRPRLALGKQRELGELLELELERRAVRAAATALLAQQQAEDAARQLAKLIAHRSLKHELLDARTDLAELQQELAVERGSHPTRRVLAHHVQIVARVLAGERGALPPREQRIDGEGRRELLRILSRSAPGEPIPPSAPVIPASPSRATPCIFITARTISAAVPSSLSRTKRSMVALRKSRR